MADTAAGVMVAMAVDIFGVLATIPLIVPMICFGFLFIDLPILVNWGARFVCTTEKKKEKKKICIKIGAVYSIRRCTTIWNWFLQTNHTRKRIHSNKTKISNA